MKGDRIKIYTLVPFDEAQDNGDGTATTVSVHSGSYAGGTNQVKYEKIHLANGEYCLLTGVVK